MGLVEHLLTSRTPLELAKELAQATKREAALLDKVDALEHELFWTKVAERTLPLASPVGDHMAAYAIEGTHA